MPTERKSGCTKRRRIYGRKERREKKRRDKREVEAEREDMRKGIVKRKK